VTSVDLLFFNEKILCCILYVWSVLHSVLVLDLRKTVLLSVYILAILLPQRSPVVADFGLHFSGCSARR
jgi:hypothetical protein